MIVTIEMINMIDMITIGRCNSKISDTCLDIKVQMPQLYQETILSQIIFRTIPLDFRKTSLVVVVIVTAIKEYNNNNNSYNNDMY